MKIPEQYASKEEYVNAIFSTIAHKYDAMNTLMTLSLDQKWRKFTVSQAELQPGDRCLDVCCGTGKLALELAKKITPGGKVVGVDFCSEMLEVAQRNIAKTEFKDCIELLQGNAVNLPFVDNIFACATIGFALRNVPDIKKTLQEMMRVVKPGGKVISLELAKPSLPVFKQLYYLYFDYLVPLLGRLNIGQGGPYSYLPQSLKIFPHQSEIKKMFCSVGLENVKYYELTGGIVAVHVGTKP